MKDKKNYIDSRGVYHNVENLTLNEIYLRGFDAGREYGKMLGYEQGKADGLRYAIDKTERLLEKTGQVNELTARILSEVCGNE